MEVTAKCQSWTKNPKINDDCWTHIMLYSDKQDLVTFCEVSKSMKILSDTSSTWFYLCKFLWQDKQFHPLEQWVTLQCDNVSHSDPAGPSSRSSASTKSGPYELECIDRTIVELENSKQIITAEMEQIILKANDSDLPPDVKQDNNVRFCALNEYKLKLEGRIVVWNGKKQKYFDELQQNQSHNNAGTQTATKLTRQAAPLSRAVRAEWIRSTEFEYFELLDQIQVNRLFRLTFSWYFN